MDYRVVEVATLAAGLVVHEAGHALFSVLAGLKIHNVRLRWFGPTVRVVKGDAGQNLTGAIGGPLTNLLLFPFVVHYPYFAAANLIIGIVNLFPFFGKSDGDAIWRYLRG